MADDSSIYTESEQEILNLTRKVRLDIIVSKTKDGVPTDNRDIRVLNEVMSAVDTSVDNSANVRLKHTDNSNKETIIEAVALALKSVRTSRATDNSTVAKELTEEDLNVDVVEGELEIAPEALDVNDFLGGNK